LKSMGAFRLPAAAVLLALVASCAYYNIYWMASDEYDVIVSDPEVSDLWDPYSHRKVTGSNAKLVDSVISRCGKLIVLYPKSKWVDDALLLMGNCFLFKGDYTNAGKKYDELLRLFARSELRGEARYMKAYNLVLQGSGPQALTELGEILAQSKNEKVKEKARFLRARIFHEMGNCERAVEEYNLYVMTFFDGRKVTEARLSLARCLLKLGRASEAVDALKPLARSKGAKSVLAGLQMGRAYRMLGQYETALETFEAMAAAATLDSLKARAKLEQATTLLERNRPEEAIGKLTEADSLLTTDLRDLKSEATYCIGIICERHLGDYERATASYQEAAKLPTSFGRLAGRRAQALKDIRKYEAVLTDTLPDSREDRAKNLFLIAETYLEELGRRPEALRQFRVVADSFPAGEFGAKSMLALGSLLQEDGDTLALRYYRTVLDSFPNTVYANVARSRLRLPLVDIVVEVPDSISASDTVSTPGPQQLPAVRDSLAAPGARRGTPEALPTVGPPEVSRRETPPLRHFEPTAGDSLRPGRPDTASAGGWPSRTLPDSLRAPVIGAPAEDTTGVPSAEDTTGMPSAQDTTGVPSPEDTTGTQEAGEQSQ
jgi:tetratricopeptide (TPR) repeat protein